MKKWLDRATWVTAVVGGFYCFIALWCRWPLNNIVWLGAANGFFALADKCSRDLESALPEDGR